MIEVNNLTKKFEEVEAVRGISFNVDKGEIYGLLGPNGAGKSTTINVIAGLLRPSSGTVTVGGFDVVVNPSESKRILGVVPQQSVVIEELSALRNCLFFGSLYGVDKNTLKRRAQELLEWIGLSGRLKEPVSRYSGGMMRRLTLVLGIIHRPQVLVLDEPTVGLDPQTRLQILEAIRKIADDGTAVLLSTHHLEEAERLCDRLAIIDHGIIIKEGTLHGLRAEIEDVQIIHLRGSFDRKPLEKFVASASNGRILHQNAEEMVISLPSDSEYSNRILELASSLKRIKEVAIKPPSLESLFITLTGREIRD